MRIGFTRSGGAVAAPGMTIEAKVGIDSNGAEVTAGDGYRRHLSPGEIASLISAVDPVRFFQLAKDLRSHSSAAADQYQYDITVETPGGKHHSVTLGENQSDAELDKHAPGLGALLEWVRHEADAIWQAKMSRR